jgi:hypothetical protein
MIVFLGSIKKITIIIERFLDRTIFLTPIEKKSINDRYFLFDQKNYDHDRTFVCSKKVCIDRTKKVRS